MKYLITGGAGFIGSHFIEQLLKDENTSKITVIDDLSTGSLNNLPQSHKIDFINASVTDSSILSEAFTKNNFDYIIHLAAVASVQDSITNTVYTHNVNFDSTMAMLELSKNQKNLKRFVFASSAAVYGNNPALPCQETGAVEPFSPYGVDKYASERFVINAYNLFGIPTTAFRFFNIYGPRQNPSSPYSGVISIFADRFSQQDTAVNIFGDGEQTRDFVYVKDLVGIVLSSLKKDEALGNVFNICTNREISLNNLVATFEKITGKKCNIEYKQSRPGDIRKSVGDNSAILRNGFISEFTSISDGLSSLMASLHA